MDDLLIIGGAVALLLLWKSGASAKAAVTVAPAGSDTIPFGFSISGGPQVSGGYQLTAPGPTFGAGLAPATGVNLPTFIPPSPGAPPPPDFVGGAPGTAGSGGLPLGGFRLGLAPIFGTTVPGVGAALVRRQLPVGTRRSFRARVSFA